MHHDPLTIPRVLQAGWTWHHARKVVRDALLEASGRGLRGPERLDLVVDCTIAKVREGAAAELPALQDGVSWSTAATVRLMVRRFAEEVEAELVTAGKV